MRAAVILVALLASCAGPAAVEAPVGPLIVLHPPKPAARPRPAAPAKPADSPAAVTRDTDALQDQATQYVVRRDSKPAVIDRLASLTLQARRAASRARRTKRPADVIAARVAADALAAVIATQAKDQ